MLVLHHLYKQGSRTEELMVINKNFKSISYEAMMSSKNLNSFFTPEKKEAEEVNAEEE